jgi:predicted GTPase
VLPAMGYGAGQLAELSRTINATPCDAVIAGTPIDLARLVDTDRPIRRVSYELQVIGSPTLQDVLAPWIERWRP